MTTTDDIRGRLETEINSLKSQIAELEQNQMSHGDRLNLEILRRLPFTIWACDRNFRIVLWNPVCEQVYGVGANEAIGAEYADLFVDPVEQQQSREDCIKTIERDVVFKNFLAYDHDADHKLRSMLTNCFRIWDGRRNEYLQAEVGLEISDLQLRTTEHRTLREVGVARLEQQKKIFDLRKSDLLSRLTVIYVRLMNAVGKEQDRLAAFREKLVAQNVNLVSVENLTKDGRRKADEETERIESKRRDISSSIFSASKPEEFEKIEADIEEFAQAPTRKR